MKSLVFVLSMLVASATSAQQIEPMPNAPFASGDQVWVLQGGKVTGKFSAKSFETGSYARVGDIDVGAMLCRPNQPPQQPSAPQPPAFTPPPFVPDVPAVVEEAVSSDGPSLLSIILTVVGGAVGFLGGRKMADDDDETDAPEKASVESAVG